MFTELSDADYNVADRIEAVMERASKVGVTPSVAARGARVSTDKARKILAWMVSQQLAHTTGNGAWTRYHAGRA